MKNILKIIIGIIVIILILLVILIILLKKENNTNGEDLILSEDQGEELIQDKDKNGYEDVTDANIFYSVLDALNVYIENIKYNENVNIDDDESTHEDNKNQNLEIVYNLLDKNYINNNNINLNNIENFIYKIDENTNFIPIKMKVLYGNNINTFILSAYLTGNNLEEKYFVIRTDNKNETFSIEFINQKINEMEDLKIIEKDENIEKNNFNHFEIQMVSEDRIVMSYLEHYRDLAINYPEIVYNNYLDDQYKKERFGSLKNYTDYINGSIDELEQIGATKYLIETNDNELNYVCTDQYKNTYIFTVSSVLEYKIKLDTYTITDDEFKTKYNNSNNQSKVIMNIDKFVKMLNNRDYNSAYKLLDERFKNNTFESEEVFEQYMRNNYPLHYEVQYNSFKEQGSNIFVQQITLVDVTEESLQKPELTVMMKLQEETDFVMSFEI